ncbi:hypothetical protein C8Q78DRAFT_991847 [Trametes maxima]|nr:hypothetical protein C8Q78DRAFT_991847 [Trametes maxima]
MPFPLPSIRIAQASPSISLEKGSYRMRAPPARLGAPSPISSSSSSPPSQTGKVNGRALRKANAGAGAGASASVFVPASYEKRMALLVALLACAMLASFGTAYWLWATAGHGRRVYMHSA